MQLLYDSALFGGSEKGAASVSGTGSDEAVLAVIGSLTARDRFLIAANRGATVEPSDQIGALVDAIRALAGAEIPHALIGGIAVGIRAEVPRATDDIDLAVTSSVDRERVVDVLRAAGFDLRSEVAHSLSFRAANGEPVQVAFDAAFDGAIERARFVMVGDDAVAVVEVEDLIEMKQRAADDPSRRRSKALRHRADIELLRGDVAEEDEGW